VDTENEIYLQIVITRLLNVVMTKGILSNLGVNSCKRPCAPCPTMKIGGLVVSTNGAQRVQHWSVAFSQWLKRTGYFSRNKQGLAWQIWRNWYCVPD